MVNIRVETRFFGIVYQKTFPTELQNHVSERIQITAERDWVDVEVFMPQDEFYAKVDALNKPLRKTSFRLAALGFAELILSGAFFFILGQNLSGHIPDTVLYIAIAMYLLTQFVTSYIIIILCSQTEKERKRIVSEFNASNKQRDIKWKCIRKPFWPFCVKQSSIIIEIDAS
ncbi:6306_t:CDS:2, partial [Paraglomus occultum]